MLLTAKPFLQPLPSSFKQKSRTDLYDPIENATVGLVELVLNLAHRHLKERNWGCDHTQHHTEISSTVCRVGVTTEYLCRTLHAVCLSEDFLNSSSLRTGLESYGISIILNLDESSFYFTT